MSKLPFAQQVDVLIHGGGPVGLISALAFARQGKEVALIEQVPEQQRLEDVSSTSFDGRVLALTLGSQKFFDELGLMEALSPYATDIQHVHVSQKGYLGITMLHAHEVGEPSLGFSILASDLGQVLWQAVKASPDITVYQPASLMNFTENKEAVQAMIQPSDDKTDLHVIHAKLLLGADGTQSKVRQILELPIEEKDYDAFGVIAKIKTEEAHDGWSFERFTETGPVALLPLGTHEHKAVYVCPSDQVEEVKAWSDEEFMAAFGQRMGERLGAYVEVSKRVAYPLKETYAPIMGKGRAVLIGNASHTQHPVAAQGLNLGVRDIEALVSELENVDWEEDITAVLQNYYVERSQDHKDTMGLTDGLIQLFQTKSPLIGHLRGLGLMALERMPNLKKRFTRKTMGI